MTAASNTHELPTLAPSEAQLLDVMYEVLAHGVPPKSTLTVEEIERFLHEHARGTKSVAELAAFVAQHGLPVDASAYAADPALGALANRLHQERPLAADTLMRAEQEEASDARLIAARAAAPSAPPLLAEAPTQPLAEHEHTAPRARVAHVAPPVRKLFPIMSALSLAAVLLLGGALFATFRHAQDLSIELQSARDAQRTTETSLDQLVQRAETLQGVLERSESERRALATRFDEFVAGEAQKRAAEEAALERMLGRRYEALRNEALQKAGFAE